MTSALFSNTRILSVGNDNNLLWARELVLKQAGYSSRAAFPAAILADEVEFDFDIVVLCRSISMEAAEELARTIKDRYPSVKIVRLSPSAPIQDAFFDAVCDPTFGPDKLLDVLARLRGMLQRVDGERDVPGRGSKSLNDVLLWPVPLNKIQTEWVTMIDAGRVPKAAAWSGMRARDY